MQESGSRCNRSPSASLGGAASSILLGLILTATFLVYARTLRFDFVHDDRGQIVENPAVHSWRFLPQYFKDHVWAGVEPELAGNYYRPLFLLWLRLNNLCWGHDPWGWHLTTILLHIAATWLVYRLAQRVTRNPFSAAAAAGIFGLHPAHIEAVAWISGVTEPLLAVAFISSFLWYLERFESPHRARWGWGVSLLLYGLAMLAKETALVLPIILFSYEWLYGNGREAGSAPEARGRRALRAARRAAPFLVLTLPYLVGRYLALQGFSPAVTSLPFTSLVYTWPSLFLFWIRHLVWPAGLSTYYDFPTVTRLTFQDFLLPAVGTLVVGLGLVLAVRKSRESVFASVWIFVPLLPLLNLRVFMRDDFAHDRYLYLPSVGLALLAGSALARLPDGTHKILGVPIRKAAILAAVLLSLSLSTVRQSSYFANNLVFYQHCVASAPHNNDAKANLAVVLGEEGRYAEALGLFQDIIRDDPVFWTAIYNTGYTHYRLGDYGKAEAHFLRAIEANPNKPQAYLYLGLTRLHLGRIEDAEKAVRQAIQIRPSGFGYHFALGVILKTRADLPGAVAEFRQELLYHPNQAAAEMQIQEIEAAR